MKVIKSEKAHFLLLLTGQQCGMVLCFTNLILGAASVLFDYCCLYFG